jgi:tetratricopeptide (TPR) repeat protein
MVLRFEKYLIFVFFSVAIQGSATDIWSAPSFSTDPAALRQAAQVIQAEKQTEATVLLNDVQFTFDEAGRVIQTRHLIYRVENQSGVEDWAETSGRWEAWHQARPEIKARVISPDDSVHWLDQNTLSDVPVHKNAPDVYSDERKYGGPLPAVAPGAIIEEQVVIRDTSSLFGAGTVERWSFAWDVPVNETRFVLSHPTSLPLKYEVHLLPNATISTSSKSDVEVITLTQGPLSAFSEQIDHAPPDVALYPEIEFSTGSSWSQVALEYARLSDEKIRLADVQALISAMNLKGSRNEVIRRLVTVLHHDVRYTGIEFGESSLIPQFPSETLKRKYGDCKDKATFLVALLRSAGIPAHLALLNTGPGRDISTKMPGIGMFDHAIVYVPASGPESELWIDATAQYSRVGTLPWMDYGRWALVISDKTEALTRVPNVAAKENVHREGREFRLAEYGPAQITEVDEDNGPGDADNREYYGSDAKKVHDDSEAYVKDAYLADSLASLDHPDLDDLNKPAAIKFVTSGRRGYTDLDSAVAAIRIEALFDRLPKYFETKEEEKSPESEQQKSREVDWWITPFVTEWQYKIAAPDGFKIRALPKDKTDNIGTLKFTQQYSANSDGTVVDALLRVENDDVRLSVLQAKDLRDAVLKARSADPIFVTFDNVGHSLVAAGKMKEGLAAYRQIAALQPKKALPEVRLARALLSAGLGEESRIAAKEATVLDPNSALAFSTLGLVLENDLIARPLKKGMDYEGAVAAYKKALTLDPKDKEIRANLGLLLEYDEEGTRYSEHARLKEAVSEFRQLKQLDEVYSRRYQDNIIYDLWYAHDYQGVLDYAASVPTNDVRKGLTLAATAQLQGVDAALKKSLEITTDDQTRSKVLVTAGAVLLRVRKYSEGAALLAEGAHGQSNESELMRISAMSAKTKPYEELKLDRSDPRAVVQQAFGGLLSGNLTLKEFAPLLYKEDQVDEKQFEQMASSLRSQAGAFSFPREAIADMALSSMRFTVDGDDSVGYKITIQQPNADARDVYVVRDGASYKIAAIYPSSTVLPNELAWQILRELDNDNEGAARKWLDRARDKVHASTGDDPLSGALFPYFWNKGQEASPGEMRTAALVLLAPKDLKGPYLETVNQARAGAKSDIERARLALVSAYAYSAQERWREMLPITEELTKSFPTSLRAFDLEATALSRLGRFSDWQQLVQERIAKYPDELAYIRSSAQLEAYQGHFAKAREILKIVIDKAQATTNDLNSYAWYSLFLSSPVDQDDIDTAMRANDLTKNNNFAILHTLGCLYAQAGRGSQARELLLKAMDAVHLEEPNSEVWFGLGLIAEQYGEYSAAASMYRRVDKPTFEFPGTTYRLAQMHLSAAQNNGINFAHVATAAPKPCAGRR